MSQITQQNIINTQLNAKIDIQNTKIDAFIEEMRDFKREVRDSQAEMRSIGKHVQNLDNSQESGHKIRNFFQSKQIQNHWGKENYLSSVVALNYKSLQYTQTAKILNQRTKNKYFD